MSRAKGGAGGAVTWRDLVVREHKLAWLKRRAELVRDDGSAPSFCAGDHWYGARGRPGLRDRLAELVGPAARPDEPVLGTAAALTIAGTTLRAALPPCRGCGCGHVPIQPLLTIGGDDHGGRQP